MGADGVTIRTAREPELSAVLAILDAAMLETEAIRDRRGERVLVAVVDDRILGGCVVEVDADPAEVTAIAVRPGRRGQGIGSALIDVAAARWGTLSAEFEADVRPFYASLGFSVQGGGDGRYRGIRRPGA